MAYSPGTWRTRDSRSVSISSGRRRIGGRGGVGDEVVFLWILLVGLIDIH